MTKLTLKPKAILVASLFLHREQVAELHRLAHEKCFIANSVKTKISIVQSKKR